MNLSAFKIYTILLISIIQISPALSQYGPFYTKERNIKGYSHYEAYNDIIKTYNQDRQIGNALRQIDSLATKAYEMKDFAQYLFLKNEVSNFYKFENKFSEGYLDLHQAMKLFASKCDTLNMEYVVSLRMLRGLLTRSGQKSRGEGEMLASQLAILKKLKMDGEPMTNTLVDYGLFLNRQGKRDESIEMLYQARTVALANDDLNSLAISDYTLISLLDGIDMEETVIDVLTNDLLLLKQAKVNIPTLVYTSFFNYMLGNRLYWNMNNVEKSIEYNLKTTACLDTLQYPMWNLKSSSHSLLAQCYSDLKNIPSFWHHFQIAKQIANTQPMSDYNRGLAYITLVEAAISIASDSAQVVLNILNNHEAAKHFQVRIVKSQALIHLQKGLITQAIETVNSQFKEHELIDNLQIPILSDSIDLQIQLEFLNILNRCFHKISEQKPNPSLREAINNLIDKQNRLYIGIVQKEVFGHEISSIIGEYHKFVTSSLEHVLKDYHAAKDQELAVSLFFSSKAIQLNNNLGKSTIQGKIESDTTQFHNLLKAIGKVQKTKTELANEHLSDLERDNLNRKLNSSLIEMLLHKHKLSQNLSTIYRAIEIPTLSQVQDRLDAKKGIIEFCLDNNNLSWILVTKNKVVVGQKVVSDLRHKISAAIYEVKTGGKTSNLGSILFTSETKKTINTLNELVIIPSNELVLIPFEWLSLPSSSKKLIETHAISYNYSTSLWYRTRANDNRSDKPTILSLAPLFTDDVTNQINSSLAYDYRGSSPLPPLPSSREEVETISNLFIANRINSTTLIGNHANGSELEPLLGEFDILHLATHGHISKSNPERSGLYLYPNIQQDDEVNKPDDDFLSLGKLLNMRISANLAVLSACNTGTGYVAEGEGIMALPRGFIYAGVPNVIASLWKVHDEKTKELMVAYYKYLLTGKSYAQALRLAKQECIAMGFLPIDWAGFVLIGG
ncbi:MAG: CHAT domain-containing protein [Tenuifilaceae bacterium]|nr:CHAT domain-containing protein [Tenuifilaceae bacterium]